MIGEWGIKSEKIVTMAALPQMRMLLFVKDRLSLVEWGKKELKFQ